MVDIQKWVNNPYLQNWFREEEKIISLILKDFDGKTVLDVGCGSGRIMDFLLKNFNFEKIVGIEKNPNLVEYLKEKYKDHPEVEIGWTNILFPEKSHYILDKKYDLVLCMGNTLGTILNWKLGLKRILERTNKMAVISVYDNSKSLEIRKKVYNFLGLKIKRVSEKHIVLEDGFRIRGFEKKEFENYYKIYDTSLGFVVVYKF